MNLLHLDDSKNFFLLALYYVVIRITSYNVCYTKLLRPVEDHSDAALVKVIDEVAEIVRSAEPAGRGKVARGLVAPGAVERMLGNRE